MDWGENFDTIVNAAMAAGVPLDVLPCVSSRVDPFGHLFFEWEAFGALSTDRPSAMDRGPIPWTSIDRFADRYGVCGDDFDRFYRLIRAMDGSYLAYFREKKT